MGPRVDTSRYESSIRSLCGPVGSEHVLGARPGRPHPLRPAMRFLPLVLGLLASAGCRSSPPPSPPPQQQTAPPATATAPYVQERHDEFFSHLERERARMSRWMPGQVLAQGFLGVGYPDELEFDTVEVDADELDNLPVIGGGMQLKLAGERFDFGVEGLLSFSFRSDLVAFAAGGGGAFVAVDVDVWVFDLYGGPFLSKNLGDRARVYAGAGPIVRYFELAQNDDDDTTDFEDDSGFGAGAYARTGLEFLLPSGTLVGFGARWSTAEVDLGDVGDSDVEDVQVLFTMTRRP